VARGAGTEIAEAIGTLRDLKDVVDKHSAVIERLVTRVKALEDRLATKVAPKGEAPK
jgi:hypothetical protein